MFVDLDRFDLQPQNLKIERLPEIKISSNLKIKLQEMFKKEERGFAKVNSETAIVQTDRNYVFFSNQWLYLAASCRDYAGALISYCDFFDKKIRANQAIVKELANGNYDNKDYLALFDDIADAERMSKFIRADKEFRPGKTLINLSDSKDAIRSVRTCKDIFGSCVLKSIPVPDASSAYLGNMIYYLSKEPELYDELCEEVFTQINTKSSTIKLSSVVKNCAREIIDIIYRIDAFASIQMLFEDLGENIKIRTSEIEKVLPSGNFLRCIFAKNSSDLYNSIDAEKPRVFSDKEYSVSINGESNLCRLTTEWSGAEIVADAPEGNYLNALVAVVNEYYKGKVKIKIRQGEYYLYIYNNEFKYAGLPRAFQNQITRRFITSLLAKPFVILTGNSGTGKTRIAKQFAEYNEKILENGTKNWELIPVGADWTDNTKLLGFFNPLADNGKGKYVSTSVIHLIERAIKNPSVPFFLILDEMNLSHVERYFSDFLSHMETEDSCLILDGYDGQLEFPCNLFVVGTVNIDETTYMFSPKVLDRANVVEFKPDKDDVLSLFLNSSNHTKIVPANDGSAEAFYRLARQVREGYCEIENQMPDVLTVFDDVYKIVEKSGFEFAYRTVREIRQYLSAAYEISDKSGTWNITEYLDEEILQKILPKIHGNRKEIGSLLDEIEDVCVNRDFSLCCKKVEQMKGRLATVQYASFV